MGRLRNPLLASMKAWGDAKVDRGWVHDCAGNDLQFRLQFRKMALARVILNSSRGLRQDIRQDMARLDERVSSLESQIGELRERMAKLEGSLDH